MQQNMQRSGLKILSGKMKVVLTIVLFYFLMPARAQQPATGHWLTLQVPVYTGKKWQWHNDGGYRTLGNQATAQQYFYRTGIQYFVNQQLGVAAGTAFFFTRTSYAKSNHEFGREFRLWQEINWQLHLTKKFQLQNRIRTEQRYFAATKNSSASTAFRFRYRLAAIQTVSKKWGIQLADEYMQQAGSGRFHFNQNRLSATALYQASGSTQLQGGYMWLLWPSSSQHILQFTVFKKISFHANGNHGNEK
jgi:Protein of unknown function (DUF2490)